MARILVGMSGGVDSSVAAARLVAQGHEVIGVSLQLYDHSQGGRAARCCSPEDFLDARRVAAALGIPYYVVNREALFSRRVLDYFVDEYRGGRTPNPCVRCNAGVKFEELAALARSLGAGVIATGHYARIEVDPVSGARHLLRARDPDKDQSYFLFDLSPEHLAMAVFPLGEMTKEAVRGEASRLGLVTAQKAESQDVCFVEGGDYRGFLARRDQALGIEEPGGDLVDTAGRVLGHHTGVSGYTVGQRRGLGVSSTRRLYVVQVEAFSGRVVLGGEEDLACDRMRLTGVRFLGAAPGTAPPGPLETIVKVRYRHAGAEATVSPETGGRAMVSFGRPQRGVSPGQAAVFYVGNRLLGGGWIDATGVAC